MHYMFSFKQCGYLYFESEFSTEANGLRFQDEYDFFYHKSNISNPWFLFSNLVIPKKLTNGGWHVTPMSAQINKTVRALIFAVFFLKYFEHELCAMITMTDAMPDMCAYINPFRKILRSKVISRESVIILKVENCTCFLSLPNEERDFFFHIEAIHRLSYRGYTPSFI